MKLGSLYERGVLSLQKKRENANEMKKETQKKELLQMKNVPSINRKSKTMMQSRDPVKFKEYMDRWSEDYRDKEEISSIPQPTCDTNTKKLQAPLGYQSPIGA